MCVLGMPQSVLQQLGSVGGLWKGEVGEGVSADLALAASTSC